jgi:opacity protein-like surface antigen
VIRSWASVGDCCRQSANEEDRHQNNLGFNAGGGVMYSLSERVGLRGDLRYFRALVDENNREGVVFRDYGFWRVTLGVTIGFRRQSPKNSTAGRAE